MDFIPWTMLGWKVYFSFKKEKENLTESSERIAMYMSSPED